MRPAKKIEMTVKSPICKISRSSLVESEGLENDGEQTTSGAGIDDQTAIIGGVVGALSLLGLASVFVVIKKRR